VVEQHRQYLEWLLLKPDPQTVLAQFARAEVNLEVATSAGIAPQSANRRTGDANARTELFRKF
jgi:hypothetical protein